MIYTITMFVLISMMIAICVHAFFVGLEAERNFQEAEKTYLNSLETYIENLPKIDKPSFEYKRA